MKVTNRINYKSENKTSRIDGRAKCIAIVRLQNHLDDIGWKESGDVGNVDVGANAMEELGGITRK